MQLNLTDEERQILLSCIDSAIKNAPSSINAASLLMPLAIKIGELKEDINGDTGN